MTQGVRKLSQNSFACFGVAYRPQKSTLKTRIANDFCWDVLYMFVLWSAGKLIFLLSIYFYVSIPTSCVWQVCLVYLTTRHLEALNQGFLSPLIKSFNQGDCRSVLHHSIQTHEAELSRKSPKAYIMKGSNHHIDQLCREMYVTISDLCRLVYSYVITLASPNHKQWTTNILMNIVFGNQNDSVPEYFTSAYPKVNCWR